jgi:general secretion pathway protein D
VKPVAKVAFEGRSHTLDFEATLKGESKKLPVAANNLEFVHIGPLAGKPPKARVHLRFLKPVKSIEPKPTDYGWVLRLPGPAVSVRGTAGQPIVRATPVTKPTPPPSKPPTEAKGAAPAKKPAPARAKQNPPIPAVKPDVKAATFPKRTPTLQDSDRSAQSERTVSLDFVNTEIVQILKALGLQAGANIVTSPDVTGKLTISLDRVTVKEALDIVCALSGLRYGRVGKTYVVTSAAKFAETMSQFTGQQEEGIETRVVPIYSGQGTQIKAAILRSYPPGSGVNRYELSLPSEEITLQQIQRVGGTPTTGAQPPSGGGTGDGTTVATRGTTGTDQRDTYVVLTGPRSRLDVIQTAVENLDRQMCQALGIAVPQTSMIVQEVYEVKGGDAEALRKAFVGEQGRRLGNVELVATPTGSRSKQVISIKGRKNEVDQVIEALRQIDSSDEGDTSEFFVYDVKYADPRSLREEIINAVPGLRASIPPASAGNPRLFQPGAAARGATETGAGAQPEAAPTQVAATGAGATEPGVRVEQQGPLTNLSLPFRDLEPAAQPMRLILRGSSAQIEAAKRYLTVVDIAPKQIALELRVMELSKEDAIRAGIDWNIFTGGAVKILRLNNSQGTATTQPSNQIGVRFRDGDVAASLDRIATKNNLIARPNLRAIDGRETELFVGEVIRYIVSITSGQNGPNVQTAELPIGVRLAVLPRVGGDGSITMDLRPRVSALRGFLDVPNGGQLPQTTERIAQSTVQVQSGDTIAIGGLIQDQDRKEASGVPLLMDIPILGQLFRKTTNTRVRTEVVLFLTVRTIDETGKLEMEKDFAQPTTKPGGKN